ncbi:hypothetical protein OG21DRAFT_1492981 [Imleria badia]|nr:hypothetical protein OG21DRAFT_1492981 [Imleria badia]
MSRTTSSNKPEQERSLLNKRSLETCPPELRQSLAYVLHLRSYWKPEGRAKLIVPTSWMAFLAFADGKCGTECVANQQCPFGSVRFESVAEARLDIPDEELPRDIVSQLLTKVGMDSCLATVVARAFQGIPRTSPRSDMPATSLSQSQGTPRRIDFALVLGDDVFPENNTRCLLLGMKEPPRMQDPPAASFDSSTFASIPEALTSHGQFHLTLLTSLMQGGAAETTTEAFPEWLVLFGLTFDAHAMRIIAYLPRRRKMDVIDCAAYVVDELSLDAGSVPACEVLLERLRLLLALTTLRRHSSRRDRTNRSSL